MLIPAHWAEGRIQQRIDGRQITVRRFGWSDESAQAAQAHADARTQAAFDRIVSGEKLERRERKVAYDGADGMPIREEIVERHGPDIVTRNSYGARCLNTPDVLFADIDIAPERLPGKGWSIFGAAVIGGILGSYLLKSWVAALLMFAAVLGVGLWRQRVERAREAETDRNQGDPVDAIRARIERFIHQHPDWHLRLYRTPAGFRVLAMHDVFDPTAAAVVDCFQTLGVDKVFARMCHNQNCFRARLSAKPWRIGIGEPLRPRPGVWPIAPERLAAREAWVARYESVADRFAACAFTASFGNVERVHPRAQAVQALHDERTQATRGLPIA